MHCSEFGIITCFFVDKSHCFEFGIITGFFDKRHLSQFGIITFFLWSKSTGLSLVLLLCLFCG